MKYHYPKTGITTKLKQELPAALRWIGIIIGMGILTALSLFVMTVWLVILFGR